MGNKASREQHPLDVWIKELKVGSSYRGYKGSTKRSTQYLGKCRTLRTKTIQYRASRDKRVTKKLKIYRLGWADRNSLDAVGHLEKTLFRPCGKKPVP